ncbi:ATPase inhibitor subunit zeta [Aureimonas psammosilenae]|uniref:ATPase inhibitor subunit zeta n=1 Tax=Aureimonas psammosilenae TaxID=2495496 RepID=UPI00186A8302|nr:ATPase inhibitor subunit zeta [Aureimonas psammosilenae]
MQLESNRTEISQRKFVMDEERSFFSRSHADVVVGLWAGAQLGLSGDAIKIYAASVMEAGVSVPGGRGGFDKLAHDLSPLKIDIDGLRSRYSQAMASYRVGNA